MSTNNIEIQDSVGNVYYPHTDANVVKYGNTDVNSALSEKINKTQIVNNLSTTEEGFVADARQLKSLNDKIELFKVAKIYPQFTSGLAEYTLNGAKTSSMVVTTLNHAINASVKYVLTTENKLTIKLDSDTITGQVSLTIFYKL